MLQTLQNVQRLFQSMHRWLLVRLTPGQGLVEYALLLAFMVIVVIGIVTLIGQNVSEVWYQKAVDQFPVN
ncbi:MAG: hypothetical protein KatS3mg057_2550 [Herpetosiphonaceae bacterium]|nr:MAG: hypothetical protein KatS3mg057_2550 [Herpetosiphonaceae bacterium]